MKSLPEVIGGAQRLLKAESEHTKITLELKQEISNESFWINSKRLICDWINRW